MIMEDQVSVKVLSWYSISPQLLHKEHLVRKLRRSAVPRRSCLSNPVSQMTHKVKEEISLRYTDHWKYLMNNCDLKGNAERERERERDRERERKRERNI